MSDRTPEQDQIRHRDLSPARALPLLRGVDSVSHVRKLIDRKLLRARNTGAGSVPRYKIPLEEIERFNRWTMERAGGDAEEAA